MTLILGIESSCDESACAVVRDGVEVLSSAVASQIARHAAHGGVVPELAAREHLSAFPRVLDEALSTANVKLEDIDGIAVTQGPGLIPALLVGVNFAKGLALKHRKPLYGVNHFAGHIYGAFLGSQAHALLDKEESYPMLALVVSGGHTSLLLLHADGHARARHADSDGDARACYADSHGDPGSRHADPHGDACACHAHPHSDARARDANPDSDGRPGSHHPRSSRIGAEF